MQWFYLGLGLLLVLLIYEKGGALGSLFLLIIVITMLFAAHTKGLI